MTAKSTSCTVRGSWAASISLDLQVVGVVGDVVDRSGQTGAVADGDQALGGQQLQSAGLVGGVVGHGDGRAVRNVCQIIALARIDAERLIVDRADADQMGTVLLVEAVEVGGVLEVVGINLAALGDEVGLDVVAELNNLEVDALLGQNPPWPRSESRHGGVGRQRPSGSYRPVRWSRRWTRQPRRKPRCSRWRQPQRMRRRNQ